MEVKCLKRVLTIAAASVIVIVIISFIGCSKPAKKPADYFPLTKGSSWEYEGAGNEFASFKREVIFTDQKRAQIRENNGGTVSTAIFETTGNAVSRIFFQAETYDKVNLLDRQPNDNTIILQAPLKEGNKWGESDRQREIVDTNAVVETPAGKFEKCIKVKISGKNSTVFEYFKEGIGMVKREFHSGNEQVISTLSKYTIK